MPLKAKATIEHKNNYRIYVQYIDERILHQENNSHIQSYTEPLKIPFQPNASFILQD